MSQFHNITVDSVQFFFLVGLLILAGWSRRERLMVGALALTGLAMAASWTTLPDAGGLICFLLPPYFVTAYLWGRRGDTPVVAVSVTVVLQIVLFLVLKRYPWFDMLGWIGSPVTVIGISYILFRQIHLLVDAPYMGEQPFSAVRYIAFMLSPWTLSAGPIQRYDAFCAGAAGTARPAAEDILAALHRGINGLIKAFVLSQLLLEPSRLANLRHPDAGWADLLLVVYGFPAYLYLNFSGYTDLMIAAARLAGFRTLPENFNRPYLALNTRDFWTRWHMSFGTWVRHYVFTPFSTWLVKRTPTALHPLAMILVAIVVFLIVGGWHGTTSNYFLFGLTQAAGVIASAAFESWRRRRMGRVAARAFAEASWFRGLSIFLTFNYTCVCLVLLNGTLSELSAAYAAFFLASP